MALLVCKQPDLAMQANGAMATKIGQQVPRGIGTRKRMFDATVLLTRTGVYDSRHTLTGSMAGERPP